MYYTDGLLSIKEKADFPYTTTTTTTTTKGNGLVLSKSSHETQAHEIDKDNNELDVGDCNLSYSFASWQLRRKSSKGYKTTAMNRDYLS